MKTMKITSIDGLEFPGLLDASGRLTDSRTGEVAKGDKWEEITEAEYNKLCDVFGLED